jgi:glycerophosphoryl diester phosphodiesterase
MPDRFFDVSAFAYAHRGLWGGPAVPENSAAAFHAARASGVGVELDVRLSSDGVPFVFHDATLIRMCGIDAAFNSFPASDLERTLLPNGLPVPTLTEALDIMAEQPVLIEAKVDSPRDRPVAEVVAKLLESRRGQCAVMSFDEATVAYLCQLVQDRPVGLLTPPEPLLGADAVRAQVARARAMGCEYLAPHFTSLAIASEAGEGLPLVTWTLRTPIELDLARTHGAGPIFEGFSPALAMQPGRPI